MGFWPFGRDPANIEMVSRVVTGQTQNGYRLRGKLTIHFSEPQRRAEADHAGDRCSTLAMALLREAPDHGAVIGAEIQLSAELLARYPGDLARARGVELAALHVVGDPTLSGELRRASSSGTMRAVSLPGESGTPSPPSAQPPSNAPLSVRPPPNVPASMRPPSNAPTTPLRPPTPASVRPPPPASAIPGPPSMRRRASSQIRSIQSLLMPPGTPPAAMGQFIAPLVKDSAARLLIGFLRGHDLIFVRGVSVDEGSAEMLATLVPASDAPLGGYEASRAAEIARWQTTLGQGVMFSLQHEVRVAAVYLAKQALARVEVMPALADAVVEALTAAAFPDEAGVLTELARFPSPVTPAFVTMFAEALTRVVGTSEDPAAIAHALTSLLGTVQDDLDLAAMIIKQSSGG